MSAPPFRDARRVPRRDLNLNLGAKRSRGIRIRSDMPRASWSALLVLLSSSTILIAAAASDHPAIAALEEMEATIASHLASARRASGGATPPPGLPPLWANWEAHLFARARDRALDAHAVAIAADPDAPRSPERAPAPLAEFESALRTARSDAEARLRAELFDLEPFASAPDANGGALDELRVELDARERAARLARAAAVERLARDAEEDARVRAHRAVAAIPVPSTDVEIDRAVRAVAIASAEALARTLEPLGFEPRETRRRALKTLRDACDAFAVAVKRASERATERALDAAFQSATREYDLETVAGFVRAGADPATVSKDAFKFLYTRRSSRPSDGFVPLAESTLEAVDAAARAAARRAFDAAARSPAPGILDDADATERLAGWIARSRAAARSRASLERELERRGEARVARNARAWHEALAPVNEAAIAAVERRLASPSSALALVASNVPWAFDGLARREWLNALDELVGAEEARAASNASFARDLRTRPRTRAALRAMTRRSSRRVAAVFAREDEAMRRKRAEVRSRCGWRVAAAACACPPLARLASSGFSILRQGRRRRSGPREKKRSKGSVPSSPSSPSSREKTTPRESRRSSWASRVRTRVNPILFAAAQPLPEGTRDENASDENADENRRAGKGFVSRFPLRPRARDASRG